MKLYLYKNLRLIISLYKKWYNKPLISDVLSMNIDFQKARENMVESQLRPNKITNKEILKLFNLISKEDFDVKS